ncbi:hypothetical protein [Terrimonas sp.]|uniref:hypothetical protein n=1 Tax=Terrimonas sp. TaxID=1914338 RepID=UPI0010571AFD|nr:hypothetical protein [Terrimonas sp.]
MKNTSFFLNQNQQQMSHKNNQHANFNAAAMLVAGQGFGRANPSSGGEAVLPYTPLTGDARLRRLCQISATDELEERRKMAERTIRKEYPGNAGPNEDISIEASIILADYQK